MTRQNIFDGEYDIAIDLLSKAQVYPENLGEGKLLGAQENDIFYWFRCAYDGLGETANAQQYLKKATVGLDELGIALFYNDQQPGKIFYQGCDWAELNHQAKANNIY